MDNHTKQLWFIGVGMLVLGVIIGLMIGAGGRRAPENGTQSAQNNVPATTTDATSSVGQMDDSQQTDTDTDASEQQQPDRSPATTQDGEWGGARDSWYVDVSNQPAGESVTIDEVMFDAASWVAVREATDGEMGNVLGAKWRPAGEWTNLDVSLLRATSPDEQYYVTIYRDNGDKEFQYAADTLVDVDGRTVYTSFRTE